MFLQQHIKAIKSSCYLAYSLSLLALVGCSSPADQQIDQSVQGLYASALSKDGSKSLVASIHHGASFWDINLGERLYNWNHAAGSFSALSAVALAANGATGLTSTERELVAWHTKNGQPIEFWQMPDSISCLALNENGTHALVGMDSGQAMIVDIHNQGFIWRTTLATTITACTFDDQDQYIALGTQAGQATLYAITQKTNTQANKKAKIPDSIWTLTAKIQLTHPYAIRHLNMATEQQLFLSTSKHHELWVTDIATEQRLYTQELQRSSVSQSAFAQDTLVLGHTSRQIELIDMNNWQVKGSLQLPKRNNWTTSGVSMTALAYSGTQLVATSSEGMTYVYNNIAIGQEQPLDAKQ